MKKLLILLCLSLLVAGCKAKEEIKEEPTEEMPENIIGMPNPMEARNSLEEVNELTHGHITKPGVMGVTQEGFYTINTEEGLIGEYDFVLNDVGYTIRFSDTIVKEDISGVWIDGNLAFSNDMSQTRAEGSGLKLARWFTVDGQYVFEAPISVSEEDFENMVEELSGLTVSK